jgi:hypothetical protein
MRDHPHFGGFPVKPALVSSCLRPESAPVRRDIKRGKNQEKEA